jgi:hypothetical protein
MPTESIRSSFTFTFKAIRKDYAQIAHPALSTF